MIDFLKDLRARAGDEEIFKKERWITIEEAQVIYNLIIEHDISDYFECGTANGFSTCWATLALQKGTCCPIAHTWDPHDRPKVWDLPELAGAKRSIQFHNEKYNASLMYWVDIERPRSVNVAEFGLTPGRVLFFVDGDHRWRAAKNDIRNTMKAAEPGDILLMHDVKGYEGLKLRFETFTQTHRTQFFDTQRGMGAVWL